MNNRSSCSPAEQLPVIDSRRLGMWLCTLLFVVAVPRFVQASNAPAWMRAAAAAPLPAHDEETDALLLYSETGGQRAIGRQDQDPRSDSLFPMHCK